MPIAGGESLKSRYEFAERLASRMFDIIQPSIAIAGGVSEMFKLGHMANAFGIHFNPHFGDRYQPVSDTACVGLSAVEPTFRLSRTIYQSICYGV